MHAPRPAPQPVDSREPVLSGCQPPGAIRAPPGAPRATWPRDPPGGAGRSVWGRVRSKPRVRGQGASRCPTRHGRCGRGRAGMGGLASLGHAPARLLICWSCRVIVSSRTRAVRVFPAGICPRRLLARDPNRSPHVPPTRYCPWKSNLSPPSTPSTFSPLASARNSFVSTNAPSAACERPDGFQSPSVSVERSGGNRVRLKTGSRALDRRKRSERSHPPPPVPRPMPIWRPSPSRIQVPSGESVATRPQQRTRLQGPCTDRQETMAGKA